MKSVIRTIDHRVHRHPRRIRAGLVFTLFAFFITFFQTYVTARVFPNTFVGGVNIGGKTHEQLESYVSALAQTPISLKIKYRVYRFPLSQMGVVVERKELTDSVFAPNKSQFPLSLIAYISSFVTSRELFARLTYTPRFYLFIENTVFDFSIKPDEIVLSEAEKTFLYKGHGDVYQIVSQHLQAKLREQLFTGNIIEPRLSIIPKASKLAVISTNEKLKLVMGTPLKIALIGDTRSHDTQLSTEELKDILTVSYPAVGQDAQMEVREEKLATLLTKKLALLRLPNDKTLSIKRTSGEVLAAVSARYEGNAREWITLSFDDGPNSIGNVSSKYIEVDISQQTMYLFQNGALVKSYRVSTGYDYPTPTGTFSIINKVTGAFSEIYSVWMPYWMAFGFSAQNNAYFGIHELPYAVSDDGTISSNPSGKTGSPTTGGCIALDIGAAKAVYDWADIGTPLVIFQ